MFAKDKCKGKFSLCKNVFLNSRFEECASIIKLKKIGKENDQKQYREEAKKKRYIFKAKLQTQPRWRGSW